MRKTLFIVKQVALCCVAVACVFISAQAFTQENKSAYATAVNIAGKQRMLIQKISKEVLFSKLQTSKVHQLTSLADTATQFHQAQLGLMHGSEVLGLPKTTDQAQLKKMQNILTLWEAYFSALEDSVLSRSIDDKLVELVTETNEKLLIELDEMVVVFQNVADEQLSNLPETLPTTINLAGRQRMLSQKMAKECLLVEAGMERQTNLQKLSNSQKEFEKVHHGLVRGNESLNLQVQPTFEIKQQLSKVSEDWLSFKTLLKSCGTNKNPKDQEVFFDSLSHLNLVLLRNMNHAVEMYESLAYETQ